MARWDSPRYGRVRASSTGTTPSTWAGPPAAASSLATTRPRPYDPVPWFWSDQYDVRLQLAGRAVPPEEGGRVAIVDGSIGDGKFVALYGRDGQVTGALGWNWPAKAVRYRMALEDGLAWHDAAGSVG